MRDKSTRFEFRRDRTRRKVRESGSGLPRLSVHRTLKYLYAQIIDDAKGVTLVSATSQAKEIKGERYTAKNVSDAQKVGKLVAEKALKAGIERVVFDRGGRLYHGRVKALADAAREAGLKF